MDAHEGVRRWGWFLVWLLFGALLLPRAASWGMFLDGVIYATISRNLAFGQGEVWKPFYTATLWPEFHEQPPLVFLMQSLWFRVFGDHFTVEKAYSVSTALIALCLLPPAWRLLTRGCGDVGKHAWLAAFLWIVMPKWAWTYQNNLLENTTTVFCLAAAIFGILAVNGGGRRAVGASLVAGACVVGGVLSKGPVGLFPLAAPAIVELALQRGRVRRGLFTTIGVGAAAMGLLGLVMLHEAARASLFQYANQHLIPALNGARTSQTSTAMGRLYIVAALIRALVPALGILVAVLVFDFFGQRRRAKTQGTALNRGVLMGATGRAVRPVLRSAAGCFLIGLAASLPIAISHKQRAFYLVPALPFFALAVALPIAAVLCEWVGRSAARWLSWLTARRLSVGVVICSILITAICVGSYGIPYRDIDQHGDVRVLEGLVPRGEIIGTDSATWTNWGLHSTLYRHLEISLDSGPSAPEREFWILSPGRTPPGDFARIDAVLSRYVLWRRKH